VNNSAEMLPNKRVRDTRKDAETPKIYTDETDKTEKKTMRSGGIVPGRHLSYPSSAGIGESILADVDNNGTLIAGVVHLDLIRHQVGVVAVGDCRCTEEDASGFHILEGVVDHESATVHGVVELGRWSSAKGCWGGRREVRVQECAKVFGIGGVVLVGF